MSSLEVENVFPQSRHEKTFDSQVSGNVTFEVGGAEEGLAALVARVALHVVVYAHVLVEGADQREGGPALVADVGPLAAVLTDVVGPPDRPPAGTPPRTPSTGTASRPSGSAYGSSGPSGGRFSRRRRGRRRRRWG